MSKRAARRNKYLRAAQAIEMREAEDERVFEHALERVDARALPVDENGAAGNGLPPALDDERALTRAVGETVERATADVTSQQPRFRGEVNAQSVFQSTYRFVKIALLSNAPSENSSVREWDKWYRDIFKSEPFLLGVFNSVVQIDKNRGWTLTGGRNQVARFTQVLKYADNRAGWRAYVDWQAQSYYFAQAGFVSECGRILDGGPLAALYSVDPTRVELLADPETPLRYYPLAGKPQDWEPQDFFRGASLVSTDETKRGYGHPAIARCLELARIMIGVYELYAESVMTKEPFGVITGKNISQDMWTTALQSYDETLLAKNKMFGKLMTLMSDGDAAPEFAVNLFRRLPEGFDLNAWTNLLMYGYALEFGYDPREFFPVSGGQLGTAKETEAQHRKATSKGDRDFSLAHQDKLQAELPETLLFEYEQRDVEGETADAVAARAKAELITEMNKWTVGGQSVLTAEQIMQLAASHDIIPEDWTPQEEDVTTTDTDPEGLERVRSLERVRRAAFEFPHEPIVRYEFPTMKMRVLFRSGDELLARRTFPIAKVARAKADDVAEEFCRYLHLYIDTYFARARKGQDVNAGIRQLLETWITNAYYAGLTDGGIAPEDFDDEMQQNADDLVFAQFGHVDNFVEAILEAKADKDLRDGVHTRANLWCKSVAAAGASGRAFAQKNELVTWRLGETEQHCKTCLWLNGQKHRRKWFTEKGYIPRQPGSETLECGGWNCDCSLEA